MRTLILPALLSMTMMTDSLFAFCAYQDCTSDSMQHWELSVMDVHDAIEAIDDASSALKKRYEKSKDTLQTSLDGARRNAGISIVEYELLSKIKGELERQLAHYSIKSDGAILKAEQRLETMPKEHR